MARTNVGCRLAMRSTMAEHRIITSIWIIQAYFAMNSNGSSVPSPTVLDRMAQPMAKKLMRKATTTAVVKTAATGRKDALRAGTRA